jgi:hypothetical protein
VKRLLAGALLIACAGCAHREPLGELRHVAGSPGGLTSISAGAGLAEGVFRFDLQLLQWYFGPAKTGTAP